MKFKLACVSEMLAACSVDFGICDFRLLGELGQEEDDDDDDDQGQEKGLDA